MANGVLLIHGLMGSPREFEGVETRLRDAGWVTEAMSLPGHGQHRHQALHDVTAADMLDHCEQAYAHLNDRCEQVAVIGHSLGGACALLLAAAQTETSPLGVVSLGTPFEHAYTVNRQRDWFRMPPNHLLPGLWYLQDQLTGFERPRFAMHRYADLQAQAQTLFTWMDHRLDQVTSPVLLGHSPHDMVVPHPEMDKIRQRLSGSSALDVLPLKACGHQVSQNPAKPSAPCTTSKPF